MKQYITFLTIALLTISICIIETADKDECPCIATLTGKNEVNAVKFTPDGASLISGGNDNRVRLWDVETGKNTLTFEGHQGAIQSLDVGLHYVVSGDDDRTVKLWDVKSGKSIHTFADSEDIINSVRFTPDVKSLISGGNDGKVRRSDIVSGKSETIFEEEGPRKKISSMSINSAGQYFAWATSASSNAVKVWDTEKKAIVKTFDIHTFMVMSLLFNPSNDSIIVAYPYLQMFDLKSGENLWRAYSYQSHIKSVATDPSGQLIASGGEANTVKLWSSQSGKHIKTLFCHSDFVHSVDIGSTGALLASGSADNTMRIYSIAALLASRNIKG